MTFKVKDLMINVGPLAGASTCTTMTRPTETCVDSLFDNAERSAQELSMLKDQLRQVMARA